MTSRGETFSAAKALSNPGDVDELRIVGKKKGDVTVGYFDDVEKLAECAARCSGRREIEGVYRTLNPCIPALLARSANHLTKLKATTCDRDILRRTRFLIDCDPVRPSGISATDDEKKLAKDVAEQIREYLRSEGWPDPFFADSGNGYHLIHVIELPNDEVARDLIRACLVALAALFDSDRVKIDESVFNASRIFKVYGTLAAKGDSLPNRPHRTAHLLHVPEPAQVVSRELLEALAAKAPKESTATSNGAGKIAPGKVEEFLALARIEHRGRKWWDVNGGGWKWQLERCWFDPSHTATSVVVTLTAEGVLGYRCLHNSCEGNDWHKFREAVEQKLGRKFYFVDSGQQLGITQVTRIGFSLTSLGDLLKEPDEKVSWLLSDKLPAGGISVLSAKPKVGKSTLARCLALAVARGEQFLGSATRQGPVIYLALEEKRSEVRRHFADLGASGEEQSGEEKIHIHCAAAPKDAMPELSKIVTELKPVLVIIDPLFKFVRVADEKAYAETCRAIEPLLTLARETGAHVMLVHHSVKAERADAMDAILGSTAIFGGVDAGLVLKRTDRYRTLQSSQKYGTDWPETVLEFDSKTRAVSLGAEKSEAEAGRIAEAILGFLRASVEMRTREEIEAQVEGDTGSKRKTLRLLVEQGKVSREGTGRCRDPFKYRVLTSCLQHIEQTTKQDIKKGGEPLENTDESLVCRETQKSCLVCSEKPDEKQAENNPGEDFEKGVSTFENTPPTNPPASTKERDLEPAPRATESSQGTLPFEKGEINRKHPAVSVTANLDSLRLNPSMLDALKSLIKPIETKPDSGSNISKNPRLNSLNSVSYTPDNEGPGCTCQNCGDHYGTVAGWRAHILRGRCKWVQ